MTVVDDLIADPPPFNEEPGGCPGQPGALRLIELMVNSRMSTIETGAGRSTVAFTAAGSRHLAISPAPDEHHRIHAYCESKGVDTAGTTFLAQPSDEALPRLLAEGLRVDVAFIDGRRSFPGPAVDYAYLSRMLRVGGMLILDGASIPSVAVVHRHLYTAPEWSRLAVADNRAVAFVKRAEEPVADDWRLQPYNEGFPDFRLLASPPWRWMLRWHARTRAAQARLGQRFPVLRAAKRRLRGLPR